MALNDPTNPGSPKGRKTATASTMKRNGRDSAATSGDTGASSAHELHALLDALRSAEAGDFAVRLRTVARRGVMREIADAFNGVVTRNALLASEMVRVERVVGREGRMTERVSLGEGVAGGWATSVGSVNALIADLVQPTTEVARVISAVAEGDLMQKMALEIEGSRSKASSFESARPLIRWSIN